MDLGLVRFDTLVSFIGPCPILISEDGDPVLDIPG